MNKRWGRVLLYLMLNVFVSAITMWVVLNVWGRTMQVTQPVILSGGNTASQNEAGASVLESNISMTEIGEDDFESERIRLIYDGEEQLQLAEWELHDEDGHVYVFININFFTKGAAVDVYTKAGTNGFSELFWGMDTLMWSSGETATLYDAEGQVRATYVIP